MSNELKRGVVPLIALLITSLAVAACQGDDQAPNVTTQVTSGKSPSASVSGTVTYRERYPSPPRPGWRSNCGTLPIRMPPRP